MSDRHVLDNAVWSSLISRHAHLAKRHGRAGMYPPDVSVFAGVESFDPASWSDLAALAGPGETFVLFCDEIPQDPPAGWTVFRRGRGYQMILENAVLADAEPVQLRRLSTSDVPQILDLVAEAQPGPFSPRTIEMGRYYGHFDGNVLCAIAGERLALDEYVEISAVCTRPEARGRGLATSLTHRVAVGIAERGAVPFLHVAEFNDPAHHIYRRLGFTERRMVDSAVVTSPPT